MCGSGEKLCPKKTNLYHCVKRIQLYAKSHTYFMQQQQRADCAHQWDWNFSLNNLYLINSITAINLHANDMLNYAEFSSSFDSKQAEQYIRFDVDLFL